MPKIKDSISVSIDSKELPDGNRHYSCDLVAPVSRFQVADLLVSKGGLESLEKRLKRVCMDEISSFLGEAKELLSGLKKVKSSAMKVREEARDKEPQ